MALEANFVQAGDRIELTFAAAVTGGEVLQLADGRACIACRDTAAGVAGTYYVTGVFDIAKGSTTFAAGNKVYFDASAAQAVLPVLTADGDADHYLGICLEAAATGAPTVRVALNAVAPGPGNVPVFCYEFDCQTLIDPDSHVLIPAEWNVHGLIIDEIFAIVTEVFAGATQDQGIVTVSDESDNSLATLTAADASADAVNDILVGYQRQSASSGAAALIVAAGEYVDAAVTQATSGTSVAGKMKVYVLATPLV